MTNAFYEELKKFRGRNIIVTKTNGETREGICKAVDFTTMRVIIFTGSELKAVKNVDEITTSMMGSSINKSSTINKG